jgi:hypothetical protein
MGDLQLALEPCKVEFPFKNIQNLGVNNNNKRKNISFNTLIEVKTIVSMLIALANLI